jgi:hypothetical protein
MKNNEQKTITIHTHIVDEFFDVDDVEFRIDVIY